MINPKLIPEFFRMAWCYIVHCKGLSSNPGPILNSNATICRVCKRRWAMNYGPSSMSIYGTLYIPHPETYQEYFANRQNYTRKTKGLLNGRN